MQIIEEDVQILSSTLFFFHKSIFLNLFL
jgi:hypothetical protein